jgi:hypothetical protein
MPLRPAQMRQMLGDPSLAGPPDRLIAELDRLDSHTPEQGAGQT